MTVIDKSKCETGIQNTQFDLISILYHALEGAATYEQYIADADQANDKELVQFFRSVQAENCRRAERAKELLMSRS